MTTNYHERNHWVGTAAEMALCVPVNPGAVWFVDSGIGAGDSYWWDGASWNAMGGGGGGGCFVCDVTNTYGGDGALVSHTTATNDTAVGYNALNAELGGGCNVAVGSEALEFNTSGDANIAVGYLALVNNTTGYANIAIGSPRPTWPGDATLGSLTDHRGCIAIGSECLTLVTERDNIGIGLGALYQAGDTYNNIGIGTDALWSLIRGIDDKQGDNIAIGSCALFELIYGGENVGIGENFSFYYGEYNVFVGHRAGDSTSNASDNIGVGAYACQGIAGAGNKNTAIGGNALILGSAEINSIDEFSDYSATVPGTVLAHNIDPWGFGLANGVYPDMRITGTDHYNGNYTITVIDSKHFYFTHAWNGDDIAAGYWMAEVDYALYANGNTACGYGAGWSNYDGSYNTYLGYLTDYDSAAVNLTNSMALGANAGFTKSNQVVIGDDNIDETLLKGTVIINELGDASWDFRVESDTEVNQIFLDSSADKLYLGGNTNAVTIDKGGELTLIGTAIVWEDLRVPVTSTKLGGTKDPHFTVFKTNGAGSQGVFLYWFDKTTEEELYFTCQVPHAYKEGTNLIAHIHWIPKTNGGANAVVSWGLEYTWANYVAVFANTSIIYTNTHLPADASLVADKHYMSSFAAINGAGKTISSMLVCRVFRDAGGTGLTDDYNDDAGMLEIDFHFENDTMGSKTETAK